MTERDFLAAEHALRLLEGEALLEARRLVAEDPNFAAEVGAWEQRLSPWLDGIPEEAPSDIAWEEILRRLDGEKASSTVVALRRRVKAWRAGTAVAAAAAAVLLMVQLAPSTRDPRPAPVEKAAPARLLVASLAAENAADALTVTFLPKSRELVVTPARLAAASGRIRELWLIPAGGRPISLGVIGSDTVQRRSLPVELARDFRADATIAISDEPAGGSPTGQPTGEVLATGTLVRV
jgi:anti-sigma-K factor RskA